MRLSYAIALFALPALACAVPDRGDPRKVLDIAVADTSRPDVIVDGEVADGGEIEETAPPTVSFENDIHGLLVANCTAVGCHGSGAGTYTLSGDVDADYAETLEEVTPGEPQASKLIKKSSGVSSHTGGPLLQPGTEEYDLVVAWIAGGALP